MASAASSSISFSDMTLLAVVDLGSNSLKVSVVEAASRREVARASEAVRIFPAALGEFTLPRETQVVAAEAVRRLVDFARGHGATDIAILGTSAVRDCANRAEFAALVRATAGVPLTIISGEVEARLVAAGVRTDPALAACAHLTIIDLGGGSLEVATVRGSQVVRARSYPLGSVRLTHGYLRGGEGVVDELDQSSIRDHLVRTLGPGLSPQSAEAGLVVGAGGVFSAVALHLEALGEPVVNGHLPVRRIRELKDKLCALPLAERRAVPGIPAERADIMPAALLTVCVLADLTGAESFHVTHRGLRHGMVELMLGPSGPLA
jgi:exopolyphosphatase/guanosine-5'-triphosphate,3'-diphosphate pyrophosphatase